MNMLVIFCGWTRIKHASDVLYAILKLVLLIKNKNNIPLKKNSSVNDSKKLMIPKNRCGSLEENPILN